jgi:hypothetical protein
MNYITNHIANHIYCGIKVFYDKLNHSLFYNDDANRFVKIDRIFESLDKYTKMTYFFGNPTLIIDNIYLGSAFNACDKEFIDDNKIGLIINITPDINNYFENNNIDYLTCKIYDNNLDDINPFLEIAYSKINDYIDKMPEKKILIHCFMGASRSATILLYYLIKKYKYNLTDAITFVKNKRNIVNLSTKFYNTLKKYEN